jgi:hypothetical protein
MCRGMFMDNKVVLIHGYNKNRRDMVKLKNNLEELGYQGILVDLPLTYKEFEESSVIFNNKMEEIISKLDINETVSLVGHSTGGLIIRNYLASEKCSGRINRCVLVATPSKGTELADWATKISKLFTNIFKTIKVLHTENIKELNLTSVVEVEIGAIAGNKNNLLLGKLLSGENDGRVTIDSVRHEGLKDFIVLPYGHKEIHNMKETAVLIDRFLLKGKFHK